MRNNTFFVCPCCGESVPSGARACPNCGSDEKTGWSGDTYLDGLNLPDMDDNEYDELLAKEFSPKKLKPAADWRAVVGAVLLIAALLFLVMR